jgi:hypothetical protein
VSPGPGTEDRWVAAGFRATDDLAAEIQVLFAEARRRRRRRRLVAGMASLALAVAVTGAWMARPGHRAGPAPDRDHVTAAAGVARFALPPAHVAWVDYGGGLHVGNVATLAQNVAGTVPAWAGAGWLVQAGGRIYGADSPVIREFNPATGRTLRVARGEGVFASADGRHAYVKLTATSLIELRTSGHGVLRRLRTPAGWSLPQQAAGEVLGGGVAGRIVVSTRDAGRSSPQPVIGVWNTRDSRVTVLGRGYVVAGPATLRGTDSSQVAWTRCLFGGCPLEITSIPSMRTVMARSPLPYGFAQGAAFSPDGSRLAVFERAASLSSPCCANSSVLAIADTRTGVVRSVRAARLETQEDAGWILWLPGGSRLLAGALLYSYAVDTATYQARPFFFYPQKAGGAKADHDIMNTPDINFSAVVLPITTNPAAPAMQR